MGGDRVSGALTHILASRWINSKDWVAIGLPRILYFNTALLLLSSATFEMGRRSLRRETLQRSLRFLMVTLLLGLAFISGQIMAWREVVGRGLLLATNPGSFFFYAFTAAHGLHLLCGVGALSFVIFSANRLARRGREDCDRGGGVLLALYGPAVGVPAGTAGIHRAALYRYRVAILGLKSMKRTHSAQLRDAVVTKFKCRSAHFAERRNTSLKTLRNWMQSGVLGAAMDFQRREGLLQPSQQGV